MKIDKYEKFTPQTFLTTNIEFFGYSVFLKCVNKLKSVLNGDSML